MDQEARVTIGKIYKRTEELLLANQEKLKLVRFFLYRIETENDKSHRHGIAVNLLIS